MKSLAKLFLAILLAGTLAFAFGCASAHKTRPVVPTVELTGTSNAPVSGYYILKGKRVELMGNLPLTLSLHGLSQLAVRKVNSEQELILTASSAKGAVSQGVAANIDEGLRVSLDDLSLSRIPPQETLGAWESTQLVIKPYWNEGTWVFDDPSHGLDHQPIFKGAPDLLNGLVKNIPNAQNGFRLLCSTKPIKDFQKKLVWVKAEGGGNYYRFGDKTHQGWLYPAIYRYFPETPKVLYLKAVPKNG